VKTKLEPITVFLIVIHIYRMIWSEINSPNSASVDVILVVRIKYVLGIDGGRA